MIKHILLKIIKGYQKTFSFDHGFIGKIFPNTRYCRFIPTCSEYSYEAIDKYGVLKGIKMSFKRVIKCNPWNRSERYDPVP